MEETYDAFLVAQYELRQEPEYPSNYEGPIPYALTPAGETYLDRHSRTHSSAPADLPF